MAANYWVSTQRLQWQFSKTELQDVLQRLENEDPALAQQYPLLDRRLLSIFYNQQLGKLAKRMSVRQQALATAQVYMRRFYIKVDVRNTNPYLVLTTALYLACKMEEKPEHIRLVVEYARNLWPGAYDLHLMKSNLDLTVRRLHPIRCCQTRGMRVLSDFGNELPAHCTSSVQNAQRAPEPTRSCAR